MVQGLEYFAKRRHNLSNLCDNQTIIIPNNLPKLYSNDKYYRYRPNSYFYYLTGYTELDSILVITSENKSILFMKDKDPHFEFWEGKIPNPGFIQSEYGFDQCLPLSTFIKWLKDANTLEISTLLDINKKFENELISNGYDNLVDIKSILDSLRIIKDDFEISVIRKSQSISVTGHLNAIMATKSHMSEMSIEAIYNFTFNNNGAILPTHNATIAHGDNGLILHYRGGNDIMQNGNLILVDTGCEYNMYTSDIARTWPVSGKFNEIQRNLYNKILNIQKECIDMIKPGVKYWDIHQFAVKKICNILINLEVVSGTIDTLLENESYKRYFPHGIGHWLGIDTHDCSTISRLDAILEPGMVLTIEPGIYLHHDENVPIKYRGIAIRIEDNILVTEDGYEILSGNLPKEIDELEKLIGTINSIEINQVKSLE